MGTELSPLQTVQENIKERIKAEFANLIPDEMWKAMVESVVRDFTTPNGRDSRSPAQQLIRNEIEAMAKTHIKAEMDRLGQTVWDGYGQQMAGEAIKKLVAENFALILADVQKGFVEFTVQQAVQHIRNSMSRGY